MDLLGRTYIDTKNTGVKVGVQLEPEGGFNAKLGLFNADFRFGACTAEICKDLAEDEAGLTSGLNLSAKLIVVPEETKKAREKRLNDEATSSDGEISADLNAPGSFVEKRYLSNFFGDVGLSQSLTSFAFGKNLVAS